MTYKCMHELATSYLSDIFLKRNEFHDLNTRNKDLNIPPYKTMAGQKSFHYRAAGFCPWWAAVPST